MTTSALKRRLERLQQRLQPDQDQQITYTCCWGDEAIDDGTPVIVTSWGRPVNSDKEDTDEDEY